MTALTTTDGVRIDACHDPGPAELGLVLAHGLTGSWRRGSIRRAVATLSHYGGVVSFDFRGHGRSGGHSTVGDREVLDLAAAVDWARGLGYRRVAVVGFSLGAAVAVRYAAQTPPGEPAAVVAISGPARWYYRGTLAMRRVHWLIEKRLGRFAGRLVLRTRIATDGWQPVPDPPEVAVARVSPTPLLVVHGDADHFFPVEHAHALYAAAAEPKELWIEPGFGHAESAAPAELLRRIGDWLTDRIASPRPPRPTDRGGEA